jgi:nucleoside-diphosphate-sugar epimerase
MAERINLLAGNSAGIRRAQPRVWDTKKRLLASIERAREILGYEPRTDFETGLGQTVQWFRENWDRIAESADFPPGMSSATRGISEMELTTKK